MATGRLNRSLGWAALLVGIALAASCSRASRATEPPPLPTAFYVTPTAEPTAAPAGETPGPGPQPEPVAIPERTAIRLEAVLDYPSRTLAARETIVFPNRTGGNLDALVLMVEAARRLEVFELSALEVVAGPQASGWGLDAGILQIDLEAPLLPLETLTLRLEYRLQLPRRPGKLGAHAGQLNLGDWYAAPPVYFPGKGWLAHRENPVGETMVYALADFDVSLEIEEAPEGLVVAASAAPLPGDGLRYRVEAFRNFTFSLNEGYEMLEAAHGDAAVYSIFRPEHAGAGRAALDAGVRALAVFGDLFGPYRHESFTIVAGNFADGLEYDGLAFVGQEYYAWYDGTFQNYLSLITVHETAHQWFYAGVGSDQALEPWVDESLALYCELLFIEAERPELADWWWEFRIAQFRPFTGRVDDPVYAYMAYRLYVDNIYLQGADLMAALRVEMGDEAFFAALREYAARFGGGFATGEALIGVMDEFAAGDLGEVWERYLGSRGRE